MPTRTGTKVMTGKIRASYVHVFEPKEAPGGGDPKYSISIIIPKDDTETIKLIEEAIEEAKEQGKGKFGGKIPKNLKTPLRDGDTDREDDEAYANAYFINANSKTKPGLIDQKRQPITDTTEFYSGCYARVTINFYAYERNGNKGIAAGLNNIQKWADGESLGGKAAATEDFADEIETAEDDLL